MTLRDGRDEPQSPAELRAAFIELSHQIVTVENSQGK
jgi:hypothetical protein